MKHVLKYSDIGESRHATIQIQTNTNSSVRASRPVLTLPFVMSFVWFPGPQFAWEHYFQQVMSQADLSLLHSVFICASSVSLCHLSYMGSFLCHLHLSGFLVGDYLCLSEFSVGIYVFFSEMICIENLSLHCIFHLWGLLSFCSLLCTHLCVCSVEIHLHSGTSTLFSVRTNRTLH